MPTIGTPVFMRYYAYDTVNRIGKTGDLANHTIKLQLDNNAPQTPVGVIAEISSTFLPGWYGVELDASETGYSILIGGKSSTAGIVIQGSQQSFQNSPVLQSFPTTAQIKQAVWQDQTNGTDFQAGGSIGQLIINTFTQLLTGQTGLANGQTNILNGQTNILAAIPSLAAIVAGLQGMIIEDNHTFQEIMKYVAAFVAGVTTGGGQSELIFKNLNGNKDRITFLLDNYNNRISVTRDNT